MRYILLLVIILILAGLFYRQYRRDHLNTYAPIFGVLPPVQYKICGIDVSRYQANINWRAVAKAKQGGHKIHFAFIKATQGTQRVDPQFIKNWKGAQSAGIKRGAYHYFSPDESPVTQALFFIKTLNNTPGELPPVLDVEEMGKLSTKQLNNNIEIWLTLVTKYLHKKPIIYASLKFLDHKISDEIKKSYPIWIAHYYRTEMLWKGPWIFWQFSDRGKIPGIKGAVDFNVFRGDSIEFYSKLVRD